MGGTSSKVFVVCLDIDRLKARLAETKDRDTAKELEAVNKPFLFNNKVVLGKPGHLEKLFSLEKVDDLRTVLDLQPPADLENLVILRDCVRMAYLGQKFADQAESDDRDPFEERLVSEEELLEMEEYGYHFVRFEASKILWSAITLSTGQDRRVEEPVPQGPVAPRKPTVQLDIPAKWSLWNLYEIQEKWKAGDLSVLWIRWRNRYARCPDPMDDLGFDDETSYPSMKPNRDVFGPPRRSRGQRGWYQIKCCPPRQECRQHSIDRSSQLPPELFDTFLRHRLQLRRCTTKDLAQLRLVCRRWAELLRDKMFHVVSLRCYEDFGDLVQLLRELPKLQKVEGYGLTWDPDLPSHGINARRYPYSRTVIPSSEHSSKIEYFLRNCQPPLAGWLACILSQTTKSAIVQSEARELCAIVSTLADAAHGDSIYPYSTRFEDGLSICELFLLRLPRADV
ncbi:hypothetical protein EIP86_002633 [Pleurotus ostreatoroseus]|nr:hypothetical protein EIP86_002633 [Pleurotus ostreatoroseus]